MNNAVQLLFPIAMIALMYFLLIRPQRKREKEIQEMRSNIKVGDDVVTIGGILGKVIVVKDDRVTLEIGPDKTRIEMTKWAVGSVLSEEAKSN